MTPYNTGKVKIGLLYTPPPPEHDEDACRLQAALLGNKPKRDWDGISIVMFVLAVVLLLFVDNADAATKLQKTYAAQLKCMKDVIYFEARGEGYAGKAAVANVVLNRAKSTAYPRDVCAVVYQNRQFSWTIDKSKHGVRVKHGKDIEAVASLALANLLNHSASFFVVEQAASRASDTRESILQNTNVCCVALNQIVGLSIAFGTKNNVAKLSNTCTTTKLCQACCRTLFVSTSFWSLQVRHNKQCDVGFLHKCSQLGHDFVNGLALVTVVLRRHNDGQVVKHNVATVHCLRHIPHTVDDVLNCSGTEVIEQEHAIGAECGVKGSLALFLHPFNIRQV